MPRFVPLLALATSFACATAHAGWYDIRNYTGTIGPYAVHLSLQTFDALQEPDNVSGSYWYDSHRTPIALHGRRDGAGRMSLCEGDDKSRNCPFELAREANGLAGHWRAASHDFPVTLTEVGHLDNTKAEHPDFGGVLDIPMWSHTATLAFVGHYDHGTQDDHVWLREIRVIEMATGRVVDRLATTDDESGLLMTEIYVNVETGRGPSQLMLHIANGKMGEDVDLRYRSK